MDNVIILSYYIRMRKFDSGVLVVQSLSHSEEVFIKTTAQLVSISSHCNHNHVICVNHMTITMVADKEEGLADCRGVV